MAKFNQTILLYIYKTPKYKTCSAAQAGQQVLAWTSLEAMWNVTDLQLPQEISHWTAKFKNSQHQLTQVENSNNTSLPLWNISNSLGEGMQLTLEVLDSNTAKNVC